MISPNELRFGNYIKDDNNDIGIITSLGIGMITYSVRLDNPDYGCEYENIKPIELTSDILIKAGFEFENTFSGWNVIHKERTFAFNSYRDKTGFYYESSLCDVELKYLHELQNVFRFVTGTELNITL
jgi:hypothetical protein